MIVSVVTNESGDILALGPAEGTRLAEDGAPTHHGFLALPGQQVHTADLPDELATEESALRLFRTHRIQLDGETASFVARLP